MDVAEKKTSSLARLTNHLQQRRISFSFRYAVLAALGQIILALFLYLVLRRVSETMALQLWTAVMLVQQLVWIIVAQLRRRSSMALRHAQHWLIYHGGTTYLSALLWGLGPGFWFFVPGQPLYQGTIILTLIAIATSSLSLHAFTRIRGSLFILFIMLPLTYSCINESGEVYAAIAIILFCYTALLLLMLGHRYSELVQSASTEVDHERFIKEKNACQSYIRQAQQIANLANWELDLISGEMLFTPEAYSMFSLPYGSRLTKGSLLDAIHPEDRLPYIRALKNSIDHGKNLTRSFRLIRPDGSLHTIKESAEIQFSSDDTPQSMFGVMFDETERITAERKTDSLYQELTRVLNHMQDTYYRTDPTGRLTQASNSIFKLLGYTPTECIGLPINDLYVDKQGGEQFIADLHAANGVLKNYEVLMSHRDGRRIWVSMNGQFIRDDTDKTIGIEGTIRDVSELKQARRALFQEKEQALVTLESIGDGVITTDKTGHILYMNPTAEQLIGVQADMARGQHYQQTLRLVDEASGKSLKDLVKHCLGQKQSASTGSEGILIKSDGTRFHLKITTTAMRDEGQELVGAVLVMHDISEVMGMAKQLSYQARHDQLTGLYNRSVFEQRTRELIKSALHDHENHVLLYMDLDQFKVVNDTCGHHAGDELLKQIAALMHERIRESDILARLGGDEFGVLLEGCPEKMAVDVATALLTSVSEFRFAWEDKAFEVGISIGLVPINSESGDITHVLSAADAACYVAKDSGRNRIHIYQPDDDAVLQRHGEMQWVHRLSSAFDNNRFQLFAQPIVHVAGERLISHYEILVRMEDEKGEIVPPGAFIPAAERYNLMPVLDRWVIRNTLEMIREAQGDMAFPPVECAINLSGQSLCDDNLLTYVVDLFDETGIPCESISFEVTETAAVANLTRAKRFISVLRGMGCSFSLDDFGAGLSSFGYLKSLPVDYLKIDGAFVRDMVIDRVDYAMVRSINEIGHLMGLKTIGEYAEDDMILLALRQAGVDYAQGNAISPPKLFSEILEMEASALRNETADTHSD